MPTACIAPRTEPGVSFKETAQAVSTLLEVTIHTLLCIRGVYPPSTFARRRSHGVPVYQSRHPEVRAYISNVVAALSKELELGLLRRATIVIKAVDSGLPLERFIIDFGFMEMDAASAFNREAQIIGAPSTLDLDLLMRGFLVRLCALDSQLLENRGETTFAVVVETKDGIEPTHKGDGSVPLWTPALAQDTMTTNTVIEGHHEPLLSVRAVETGVIDLRMVVQECVAKAGVQLSEV